MEAGARGTEAVADRLATGDWLPGRPARWASPVSAYSSAAWLSFPM